MSIENREEVKKAYQCLHQAYHAMVDLENNLMLEITDGKHEKISKTLVLEIEEISEEIDNLQTRTGKFLTDLTSDRLMNSADLSYLSVRSS